MRIGMTIDKLLEQIIDIYVGVDGAHGKFHIRTCLENAKVGFKYENPEKYGFTKDQILVTVAFHDIGLLERFTPGKEWDELRKVHNVLGKRIFKELCSDKNMCEKVGIDYEFLLRIVGDKVEEISDGILRHRASVNQVSWLDKFVRCCDGLNNHKTILSRAYLFGIKHFPDKDEAFQLERIKVHLTEKYLTGGYAESLPQKWANDTFKKEIKLLGEFLEKIEYDKKSYTKLLEYIKDTVKMITENN